MRLHTLYVLEQKGVWLRAPQQSHYLQEHLTAGISQSFAQTRDAVGLTRESSDQHLMVRELRNVSNVMNVCMWVTRREIRRISPYRILINLTGEHTTTASGLETNPHSTNTCEQVHEIKCRGGDCLLLSSSSISHGSIYNTL